MCSRLGQGARLFGGRGVTLVAAIFSQALTGQHRCRRRTRRRGTRAPAWRVGRPTTSGCATSALGKRPWAASLARSRRRSLLRLVRLLPGLFGPASRGPSILLLLRQLLLPRRGALDERALRRLHRLAVARGLLVLQVEGRRPVARALISDLRHTCEPCGNETVLHVRAMAAIPGPSAAHPRRPDGGRRLRASPVRRRIRGRGPCQSYARHGATCPPL